MKGSPISMLTTMPTIGVVGITIPGAIDCVKKINQHAKKYFEPHQHPNIVLHQLDFGPTHHAQLEGDWGLVENRIMQSVDALTSMGADFIIIPANTVHRVITSLQSRASVPILSMLDVVSDACRELQLKQVAVMGTSWTMAGHLYKVPFEAQGINEMIPSESDQAVIQRAIFDVLIPNGESTEEVTEVLLGVVARLKLAGCDGIALACTELPLALNDRNCGTKTLDTTSILALAAVKQAADLFHLRHTLDQKPQCR